MDWAVTYCLNKKEETCRTPEHSGCSQALVTCMDCVSSGSHISYTYSKCHFALKTFSRLNTRWLCSYTWLVIWVSSLKKTMSPSKQLPFYSPYTVLLLPFLKCRVHAICTHSFILTLTPTLHLFVHDLWIKLVFHLCCLLRCWFINVSTCIGPFWYSELHVL